MYNFNLPPIIERNLPMKLRVPRMVSWIMNLCYPLTVIQLEFNDLRSEIDDQYNFNGLKHSLEWALNDRFDPVLRRIYIEVNDTPAVALYQEDFEPSDTFYLADYDLPAVLWMEDEEYNELEPVDYEFTVRVHPSIDLDVNEARAILDCYRWAGLRPRIVWFGEEGFIGVVADPNNQLGSG